MEENKSLKLQPEEAVPETAAYKSQDPFHLDKPAIKHVVFDLGGVLVLFDGKKEMAKWFHDPNQIPEIFEFYFPKLWNDYDQGLVDTKTLIEMGIENFPYQKEELIAWLSNWPKGLDVFDWVPNMMEKVRAAGLDAYILSNLPDCAYEYTKEIGLLDLFDGGIYSYQHHLCKPDLAIYQLLLDTYDLKAEDCLFLDDKKENIDAAKRLGFQAVQIPKPELAMRVIEALQD